jgi:hypothetical protein
MNGGIDDQVKKFRKAMDYQRTDDYVKTFWNFEGTYGWNLIHTFATVTYMGKLDIGKYTKHIVNFEMPTNAINNYYMMELNGNFIFMMQLGKMTEKYMSTISDILSEMGLEVKINAEVHSIITDSDVTVL